MHVTSNHPCDKRIKRLLLLFKISDSITSSMSSFKCNSAKQTTYLMPIPMVAHYYKAKYKFVILFSILGQIRICNSASIWSMPAASLPAKRNSTVAHLYMHITYTLLLDVSLGKSNVIFYMYYTKRVSLSGFVCLFFCLLAFGGFVVFAVVVIVC